MIVAIGAWWELGVLTLDIFQKGKSKDLTPTSPNFPPTSLVSVFCFG